MSDLAIRVAPEQAYRIGRGRAAPRDPRLKLDGLSRQEFSAAHGWFYLLVGIESLRGRVSGFVVLLIKTGDTTSASSATKLTDSPAICLAEPDCCTKTGSKG